MRFVSTFYSFKKSVFVSFSSSYNSEGIMPFIFLIDFLSFSTFSGEKIYLTLGIKPLIFLTEGLLAGGKIDIAKLLGSEITWNYSYLNSSISKLSS